jgi:mannose/cellobiose epimerase-like protein (N-acyl-D-glucosamine 2-epimerase family)
MHSGLLMIHQKRFEGLMKGAVLPLWAGPGFIREQGLYCERMSLEGSPVTDVPMRAMVQARQIFVFTHAERTGVMHGVGETALGALDRLLERFSDGGDLGQGLAFSIAPNGDVVSASRDAYAHAFILFALASAYQLSRDKKLTAAVDAIVAFMDDRLTDKQFGGVFDRYPDPAAIKLQNPLMHLLEAFLALHEAWPDRGFLERAADIVALFRDRLFRPAHGALLERYALDWSTPEPPEPSAFFEPGHHYEWVWLLQWYDRIAGTDHGATADQLWRSACDKGLGPDGLCLDEVAFDSALTKRTHRLWPHTEGVKAAVVCRRRGDPGCEKVLAILLNTLNSVFLAGPFRGGWVDRVDADGNPQVNMVPASTLYHLYSALVETSCGQIDSSP